MDTQNTPIHIKLWHRDFWLLMIATLCLSVAAYMQIPTLALHMREMGYQAWQVGMVLGVTGLGLFVFGPWCGYWVERYRRSHVCTYAMLGVAACVAFLYQVEQMECTDTAFLLMCVGRFLFGAFYGLSTMVLFSTLIIDMCESFQRTEANYALAWFARFALAIGPAVSLFLCRAMPYTTVFVLSGVFILAAFVLVSVIRFPFKAPYDQVSHIGTDRFLLTPSLPLFANLACMSVIIGLLLTIPREAEFFAMMMVGFLLSLMAEKYAFANANLKSEVVTGLIMIAAVLMMDIFIAQVDMTQQMVRATLLGLGIGLIGSRFQLFFVKLAKHCQRGTSQSSFLLAWELGIAIGITLGFILKGSHVDALGLSVTLWVTLALVILNLGVYILHTHSWYEGHRNR